MATSSRTTTSHGSGPGSDDFAQQLQQGTEALNSGRLVEARQHLERAHTLQPKNPKVQSLLGLCCFKLGALDRASELYEALVRDNPVEPTLRVNLGLVYLKLGALQQAIHEFETGVDLAPEQKKAQNYLGLALAQAGELSRAREAFLAAGSASMVEKMERALAERNGLTATTVEPVAARKNFAELDGELEGGAMPSSPGVPPPPVIAATPMAQMQTRSPTQESVSTGALPGSLIADTAEALRLTPALTSAFQVHAGLVGIRVSGEVLTRLEHLVAILGQVTVAPEMKRFRGRATDKPFGRGTRRFVRATGQGLIWVSPEGKAFLPLDLGEQAAYFAEEVIFGFEETLTFENGRLPGKNVPDINLVHLRGRGKVLLSLAGALRSIEVAAPFSAQVAIEHLVGWLGGLTPKLVQTTSDVEGEPGRVVVELSGDGFALICLPEPK
jgi:hypothetical protein